MKAIDFDECNNIYAENQPEYLPLECHRDSAGKVTSCWGLSFKERIKALLSGKIWLQILTFNKPLQPVNMTTDKPEL